MISALIMVLLLIFCPDVLLFAGAIWLLIGLTVVSAALLGPTTIIVFLASVVIVATLVSSIRYVLRQRQEAAMRKAAQRALEAWQRSD
jgi:membrane protein implicated in regulation of membrane protease activity